MEANENSGQRKIKRFKVAPSSLPRPSSFFPRSPAARRTDPLTEGLEQAKEPEDSGYEIEIWLETLASPKAPYHLFRVWAGAESNYTGAFIRKIM